MNPLPSMPAWPRRGLRGLLAGLLFAAIAPAAAQAPRLAWRHLDERLTLGLNPTIALLRGGDADAPGEDLSEEEKTLVTMLRENPDNPAAQVRLAGFELRRGLRARAAERFLQAARADGAHREALSGLAACLLADGSFSPAAKLLQEMERQNLARELDRFNLAFAHYRMEKYDDAARGLEALLAALEPAGKTDPKFLAATAFNLAGIRLLQNRTEDAGRLLEKVKAWEQGP